MINKDDDKMMKALILKKPYTLDVEMRDRQTIVDPNDVIIRTIFAGICGSDLHIYDGAATMPNTTPGHEAFGVVEQLGEGVKELKKGDLVVIPFDVGCGFCNYCRTADTAYCETSNAGRCGTEYSRGDITGAQAEYLRVPYADFNALKVKDLGEKNIEYIFLADNFPTAWYSVVESGFQAGDSIAIFGAGSVGLLTAYSAKLQGASNIFVIDSDTNRLRKAENIGAIPVNYKTENVLDTIFKKNNNMLVDRGIDAVGLPSLTQNNGIYTSSVINQLIDLVKSFGGIYVTGVYPTNININLPYSKIYYKGIRVNGGKTSVHRYNRKLYNLIVSGKASPSKVVFPKLISIEEAPEAYNEFFNHKGDLTKAIIHFNF